MTYDAKFGTSIESSRKTRSIMGSSLLRMLKCPAHLHDGAYGDYFIAIQSVILFFGRIQGINYYFLGVIVPQMNSIASR